MRERESCEQYIEHTGRGLSKSGSVGLCADQESRLSLRSILRGADRRVAQRRSRSEAAQDSVLVVKDRKLSGTGAQPDKCEVTEMAPR